MGQIRETSRMVGLTTQNSMCPFKISCCQIEKGISRIGKPLEDINTAIENAGKLEIYKLEKNVSMLATISGAGPMTGFRDSGGNDSGLRWLLLVGK
jgi:biopolymer transport protein ExbB